MSVCKQMIIIDKNKAWLKKKKKWVQYNTENIQYNITYKELICLKTKPHICVIVTQQK